jgi:bacterioferritin-associated ferredoxin
MYVCVCNALSERDVGQAIASGRVNSAADVYRHFRAQPQCGLCQTMIEDLLRAGGVTPEATPARGGERWADDDVAPTYPWAAGA